MHTSVPKDSPLGEWVLSLKDEDRRSLLQLLTSGPRGPPESVGQSAADALNAHLQALPLDNLRAVLSQTSASLPPFVWQMLADPPSPYRGEEYRGEYGGGPEDEDFDENAWRENQDLAERFSVSLEAFPKYFFFPADWKDGSAPVPFEGEESKDNFLRFVQEKAGVWVGMPGQVKELHVLAKGFAAASDAEKQAALKTAEASKDEAGKYYAKVMTKVMASADFVAKETARLTKMMDDGSVAAGKKEQFRKRLNALSSFGE